VGFLTSDAAGFPSPNRKKINAIAAMANEASANTCSAALPLGEVIDPLYSFEKMQKFLSQRFASLFRSPL
jgi:hypothetical protein